MKDYTSVLNIMKPKLGQSAKKPLKRAQKEKKSLKISKKIRSLANFKTLFRGLIPFNLTQMKAKT